MDVYVDPVTANFASDNNYGCEFPFTVQYTDSSINANKISDENPSFLDKISEIISRGNGEYSLFLAQSGIEVSLCDESENPLKKLTVIMNGLGSEKKDVVQIDLRFPEQGIVRFREGRKVNKQSGRSS